MAMIHWRLGDEPAARDSYEQGIAGIEPNGPASKQIESHRVEAAELLGIADKPAAN